MKELFFEIRDHIKSDFKLSAYLYVIILVYAALALSYGFGIDKIIVKNFYGKNSGYIFYPIYYMTIYYITIIPLLIFKKKTELLKNKEFWIKSIIFLVLLGLTSTFYEYKEFAEKIGDNIWEESYLKRIFGNLKRFLPFVTVLLITKLLFDRNEKNFYGLRFKGLNYKPYFTILLILIPLVVFASFLPDFQKYYPRCKFWLYPEMFGFSVFKLSTIYELAYSLDFVSTELFFRGALVVGMAKVLGKESILPMASIYCMVHFGKPIGEAMSSFIGGYILGIIALNHKNINGGIIVHLGLALMMELGAIIQHFANS